MSVLAFLSRWSRRSLEHRSGLPARTPSAPPAGEGVGAPPDAAGPGHQVPDPPLPDPDMLGADSDYTAFLRPGVPAAVRAAALRRAWVSDPAIVSFRGMAEYDWDFNDPAARLPLAPGMALRIAEAVLGPLPLQTPGADADTGEAPEEA
ncbi:DUF3306 domain-containing protein [Alsobacter sp. R-9]